MSEKPSQDIANCTDIAETIATTAQAALIVYERRKGHSALKKGEYALPIELGIGIRALASPRSQHRARITSPFDAATVFSDD